MILFLIACMEDPKEDLAGASCDRTESHVDRDEATPLGFTPAELVAWLEGSDVVPLTLTGQSAQPDLEIVVDPTGIFTWVDLEPAPSSGGMEPAIAAVCEDGLEAGVIVEFNTAGGEFAEQWDVTLLAGAVDAAAGSVEVELDALEGDYAPAADAIEGCDDTALSFTLGFAESTGPSGEIGLSCEATDGDTVSMSRDVVGTWGGAESE